MSSIRTKISIVLSIIVAVALIFGLLIFIAWIRTTIAPAPAPNTSTTSSAVSPHFYLYGHTWCPFTKGMMAFLKSAYGENALTFYDIDANTTYKQIILSILESVGRLEKEKFNITPITVVTYNGTVSAVIFGEIRNKPLIDSLLLVNSDNKILVFKSVDGYSYKSEGFLVINNGTHQDLIKYLNGEKISVNITFMGIIEGCVI